jgi:hypothetical protein
VPRDEYFKIARATGEAVSMPTARVSPHVFFTRRNSIHSKTSEMVAAMQAEV